MMHAERIKNALHRRVCVLAQLPRIYWYRALSRCKVVGSPRIMQPVQIVGRGVVEFRGNVTLGCYPSPFFFSGYSYIESRTGSGRITIDDGTWINNNFVAISAHKGIHIGKRVLIGTHVEIYDSDFHRLDPAQRHICVPEDDKEVVVEDNVFIGSNAKIMKGVRIGRDSVIANGSIVVKDVPSGVIAGGNPAKVLRTIR